MIESLAQHFQFTEVTRIVELGGLGGLQGQHAEKDSKNLEIESEKLFMRVNANYNIGLILKDKTRFDLAYTELLGFWKNHPETVTEGMVNVLSQLCRVKTVNTEAQLGLLLGTPQEGLLKPILVKLLEIELYLAKAVGNNKKVGELQLQLENLRAV